MMGTEALRALAIGGALLCMAGFSGEASAQGRRGLVDGPHLGRCHMGGCSWFQVTAFSVVRERHGAALIRLTTREGGSGYGNTRVRRASRRAPIQWGPPAEDYWVLCSTQRPAIIMKGNGDAWSAVAIAPAAPAGATEFVTAIYNHACHPGVNMTEARARRLGYREGSADAAEIPLQRPEDIFAPR